MTSPTPNALLTLDAVDVADADAVVDTLKQLTMPTLKQLTSPTQTPLLAIADAIAVELNHFNDSDDIANTRKPVWI